MSCYCCFPDRQFEFYFPFLYFHSYFLKPVFILFNKSIKKMFQKELKVLWNKEKHVILRFVVNIHDGK